MTQSLLPWAIFSAARQNEYSVVILHKRMITPLREKLGPALRVAPNDF